MQAYAVIEDGVVAKVIMADADFAAKIGAIPAGTAGKGDAYADGAFTPRQPTEEEVAYEAMRSQERADRDAITRGDKQRPLLEMTPAQVRAWIDSNVRNLAEAKDVLATLAVAVSIISRKL